MADFHRRFIAEISTVVTEEVLSPLQVLLCVCSWGKTCAAALSLPHSAAVDAPWRLAMTLVGADAKKLM